MATESGSSDFASGSPNFNDNADQVRSNAAADLGAAADAIRHDADQGANRARRAAHRTANALSSSADYIRDHNVRDVMDDAMKVVKDNPGVALLSAVAIGFLVGRVLSSRSN